MKIANFISWAVIAMFAARLYTIVNADHVARFANTVTHMAGMLAR